MRACPGGQSALGRRGVSSPATRSDLTMDDVNKEWITKETEFDGSPAMV